MSDKNNFQYIIAKLDLITESLINISKEIRNEFVKISKEFKETEKLKTYSRPSAELKNNTSEFFKEFLKPYLEREITAKRKFIIKKYVETKNKAEITIGKYLRELELKGFIISEKDRIDGKSKIFKLI